MMSIGERLRRGWEREEAGLRRYGDIGDDTGRKSERNYKLKFLHEKAGLVAPA